MPIPPKYTDQQIRQWYKEYHEQALLTEGALDLKTWCEKKGVNYRTIYTRFTRIEKSLAKGIPLTPPELDTVTESVLTEISAEDRTAVKNYITLGKAIWGAYTRFAAKKGMDISEIRATPIHRTVLKALEKEAEYDRLAKRTRELERQVGFYEQTFSPQIHMRNILALTNEALVSIAVLRKSGFPIRRNSKIIRFYNQLINNYASVSGVIA